MQELAGQVAMVTGGSRGIGLAISRALADAGARVAVIGQDATRAATAAAALPGSGHAGYACNVADPAGVQATTAQIEKDLGEIAILVNNAGITRDNLLVRLRDQDWDDVLGVNLKGAFNTIRAVAKGMMRRRAGSILNVTSVVGITGNPGQANYSAAKAGLIGLTKSVARELAPRGIRCNAIAPGYIETDMTAGLNEEQTRGIREKVALGRLGQPEDVAAVARFLVGPGAGYITGQVLVVDGGMVL
ncbi:MAG: 3-oxoacyl-[acyl-carrier-protein] reductase [Gemmatimonadetes bacterium]|nr:3-oxoacyl-[acyl-carrier-protein] reductase [Gemmatimonadota bacterium]